MTSFLKTDYRIIYRLSPPLNVEQYRGISLTNKVYTPFEGNILRACDLWNLRTRRSVDVSGITVGNLDDLKVEVDLARKGFQLNLPLDTLGNVHKVGSTRELDIYTLETFAPSRVMARIIEEKIVQGALPLMPLSSLKDSEIFRFSLPTDIAERLTQRRHPITNPVGIQRSVLISLICELFNLRLSRTKQHISYLFPRESQVNFDDFIEYMGKVRKIFVVEMPENGFLIVRTRNTSKSAIIT